MKNLQKMFDYVDQNEELLIRDLSELCSFRSVAGDREGLQKTREFIREKMNQAGIENRELMVEDGNSMILGVRNGERKDTVLFYNHYDVVEEGDREKWINKDPYHLTLQNGSMYARGISDNKGALMSRIHAIQAILSCEEKLPVNVKFLVEGDEETASPSMFRYQKEHPESFREAVKADVCFWENGRRDRNGYPWARFGVRGNCSFDLKVKTADTDVHGRMGATVPSASWRLIWALGTLKQSDERIAIEGFYDDVIPPTETELEILKKFPYDEEKQKKALGLNSYLLNASGEELKRRIYLEPTLSVCGMEAGELYNGPRGIVPHTAWARISFYLVADQDPEKIHKLLREHLDKHGFSDVEVHYCGGTVPVKTPTDIPVKKQLEKAAELVYDKPLVIELTQLGAGPAIAFRRAWENLPIIGVGPGNTGSNHHAPNENLTIEDYKMAVKHMIAFLFTYLDNEK